MSGTSGTSQGILQVVDGSGEIQSKEVQNVVQEWGIESCGVDYSVVSIMGPQSSGKSTLMNHLFGTRFDEMDALSGRQQTTHGIWLAKSPKVGDPPTLVMDLEGSDGRERGEDDTSFERQSALFALAVADILLVNMWAKDVGRETGAGKPLLKTIFQVNLKLFQPAPGARRTVLMFVFRDRTKTPLEKLKETWECDLQRMWESLAKPPDYENSSLEDFFDIQYAALSNYEDRQDEFLAETTLLRRRFTNDAGDDESLLRKSAQKLPGQALALSMVKVWEVIKENKDLNLPAHRVMVATIRCKEIATAQVALFQESEVWKGMEERYKKDLISDFGAKVSELVDDTLSGYDEEARYFDSKVSQERRESMIQEIQGVIYPLYEKQLALASAKSLDGFKRMMESETDSRPFTQKSDENSKICLEEFDAIAKLLFTHCMSKKTESAAKEALRRDLVSYSEILKSSHLKKSVEQCCDQSQESLSVGMAPLLENPPLQLWTKLETLVQHVRQDACIYLGSQIEGYGATEEETSELIDIIDNSLKLQLKRNAQEAANTILPRMKERFSETFHKDENAMPRTWSPGLDVSQIAKESKRAAAVLLSQFAIISFNVDGDDFRTISDAILSLSEATGKTESAPKSFDIHAATSWPNVASEDVLLTPAQVRSSWRQFSSDVALSVQQAVATQEANRLARNRVPPVWAIVAMFVLGFNELISVLRNPLWLVFILILLAFARTVYQELDVEGEMQNGLLPGIMNLSVKFVPTIKTVVERTIQAGKKIVEGPHEATAESPGPATYPPESTISEGRRHIESELIRRRIPVSDCDSESATDMDIDKETTPIASSFSRKDD